MVSEEVLSLTMWGAWYSEVNHIFFFLTKRQGSSAVILLQRLLFIKDNDLTYWIGKGKIIQVTPNEVTPSTKGNILQSFLWRTPYTDLQKHVDIVHYQTEPVTYGC